MINMSKKSNKFSKASFTLYSKKGNNNCLPHRDVGRNTNVVSICFTIEEDIE